MHTYSKNTLFSDSWISIYFQKHVKRSYAFVIELLYFIGLLPLELFKSNCTRLKNVIGCKVISAPDESMRYNFIANVINYDCETRSFRPMHICLFVCLFIQFFDWFLLYPIKVLSVWEWVHAWCTTRKAMLEKRDGKPICFFLLLLFRTHSVRSIVIEAEE